jgi:Tol biopolymer transport system component
METTVKGRMRTATVVVWGLVVSMLVPLTILPGRAIAQGTWIKQGVFPTLPNSTSIGNAGSQGKVDLDYEGYMITLTGSGQGAVGKEDAFFFAWKKIAGDVACQTYVRWPLNGKNPRRNAGWMIRAGLEPDAPFVDAVIHADRSFAMRYRTVKGGEAAEIKSPIPGMQTFALDKTGDQFTFFVEGWDNRWHAVATVTVPLGDSVYAGLMVASHDPAVQEKAIFANMSFVENGRIAASARVLESSLETLDIASGVRSFVRRAKEHIEAPNWSRDGASLMYNSGGRLYSIPAAGGNPQQIILGKKDRCNNDHGLSWDGSTIAFSHTDADGLSRIYLAPAKGGKPRLITKKGPSYWHGWSPDGKTLAYCAERKGEFDVYTIPVGGGKETRLTSAPGLDDGPEYSPDGKTICFNSVRTGQMKIWKMNADGSNQEQVTPDDDYADWFPHPSPDGKYIVFLSYHKSVEGHPPDMDVVLRLMPAGGGEVKTLAHLFGGQGTLNVHSWSPDSKKFAFVSYRRVSP